MKKTYDISMITADIVNQNQTRLINSYMIGNEIEGVMHNNEQCMANYTIINLINILEIQSHNTLFRAIVSCHPRL